MLPMAEEAGMTQLVPTISEMPVISLTASAMLRSESKAREPASAQASQLQGYYSQLLNTYHPQ